LSEVLRIWIDEILFIFQRLDFFALLDIALVTLVFFAIMSALRYTQAAVLLRGVILVIALTSLLTNLKVLPAFSWLIRTTFPALILAVPVIFAPEIRRGLERLGRAGQILPSGKSTGRVMTQHTIDAVVTAANRLSSRKHGALIIIKRQTDLQEYVETGVRLDALVTPELLLQVFYPNTPLHDGAVIMDGNQIIAAACVMPLSSSGILSESPERPMGLRHRAALGMSEVSDATVVIVSEETGMISIVQAGRIIRRLDSARLQNILRAFFLPEKSERGLIRLFRWLVPKITEKTWMGQ